MPKILTSIRLEKVLADQLREISDEIGWNFSETIRYLISVSYSMLHPYVKITAAELCKFLVENEEEDGTVPVWKIVQFLSPRAVEQIEELEKQIKEKTK